MLELKSSVRAFGVVNATLGVFDVAQLNAT